MKYQEFYFRKALEEKKILIVKLRCNHENGTNFNNNIEYPILFPHERVNDIENVISNIDKSINYFFQGLLTESKEWILYLKDDENTFLNFSDYGRHSNKFILDAEYFKKMASSKFTLCPTDIFPWSYRFFEAIICRSIPILNDNEIDIFSHNFKFYRKSETHIYREDWVEYNINQFKLYHMLKI